MYGCCESIYRSYHKTKPISWANPYVGPSFFSIYISNNQTSFLKTSYQINIWYAFRRTLTEKSVYLLVAAILYLQFDFSENGNKIPFNENSRSNGIWYVTKSYFTQKVCINLHRLWLVTSGSQPIPIFLLILQECPYVITKKIFHSKSRKVIIIAHSCLRKLLVL